MMAILPLLRANWKPLLIGGAMLALALGFWIRGQQLDACRETVTAERAAHAVTRDSLAAMRAAVDRQNAAALAARAEADMRQKAASEALRRVEGQEASLQAAVTRLRLAASTARPGCTISKEVSEIWPAS